MFIGRTDAEVETPILWPLHAKSWLIGRDPDAGRDWGQEENGTTEDEMAGWHRWLNGHESEWTPGVGDGQGGLACCNSWGHKESDTTERLNWTELNGMWIISQKKLNSESTSIRMAQTKSYDNSKCWQLCKKFDHSYTVGWNVNDFATLENSLQASFKMTSVSFKVTNDPAYHTPGHLL